MTTPTFPATTAKDFSGAFERASIILNNARKAYATSLARASDDPSELNIIDTLLLVDSVKEATQNFLEVRAIVLDLRAQEAGA